MAKEAPELPLAPLVDCVFLLLIFFMVTTVFSLTPGLDVKLPEAEKARTPKVQNMFLTIDEDGNMKLNRRSVTFANLEEKIKETMNRLDTKTFIIQADKRTLHGVVVKAMDVAKKAGVAENIIATTPPEEEKKQKGGRSH